MSQGPLTRPPAPRSDPADPETDPASDPPADPETEAPTDEAFGSAEWKALGTYVQLAVVGGGNLPAARAAAAELLDAIDASCSRFRDDSDLMRANRNAGAWTRVHPLLVAAVEAAVGAAERTGGLVDPTLGLSLVAVGYDRTFEKIRSADGPAAIPRPALPGAWRAVATREGELFVPEGVALDLGATGKAFAADLASRRIADDLGVACIVSFGGDVAVGVPAGREPVAWPVTVSETPDEPATVVVRLPDGGLATSTTLARRWVRGGHAVHHILDPATGLPVERTWRTASVRANSCLLANTASTAAILLGTGAPAWLAQAGVAARLVGLDGEVQFVGSWTEEVT